MENRVVNMLGKPVKSPPQQGAELLMGALLTATYQWREGVRMCPEIYRNAMSEGSGYAHTIRAMRRDLEFIERTLKNGS